GAGIAYKYCYKKLMLAKAVSGDKLKLLPNPSKKISSLKSKILSSKSKNKGQDVDVENNLSSDSTDSSSAEAKSEAKEKELQDAVRQLNNWSIKDTDSDGMPEDEFVGEIQYSLEYDFQDQTLIVKVISAKELTAMDMNGTSDPYVKVTLLPDKGYMLKSKVKRSTLNPKWNESFYFEGFSMQKLQTRILHLHVYDYDRFSRDDSIGEIHIPLCQNDFAEKKEMSRVLKPLKKNKRGEILTSLLYEPIKKQITLNVVKCKNLMAMDIGGKSDPFLKIQLKFGGQVISKFKTEHQLSNLNPVFNFNEIFEVPWEKLKVCQIDILVMDYDRWKKNEVIGKVTFGKEGGSPTERKHYNQMINKPNEAQIQWHRLKPE
ncbi:unnamed protein product, partial [Meganyctiphanes norvegica]